MFRFNRPFPKCDGLFSIYGGCHGEWDGVARMAALSTDFLLDIIDVSEWKLGKEKLADVGLENGKRVLDVNYRLCMKSDGLKGWPLQSDMFRFVQHLLNTYVRAPTDDIFVTRDEVLTYEEGCFFRKHEETDHGDGHFGNLLFVCPSWDLEGGELIGYEHNGNPVVLSNGKERCLVFLPLGYQHEVTKILCGRRTVYKAAVHQIYLQPPMSPIHKRRSTCKI
jgi:hypothetical protein